MDLPLSVTQNAYFSLIIHTKQLLLVIFVLWLQELEIRNCEQGWKPQGQMDVKVEMITHQLAEIKHRIFTTFHIIGKTSKVVWNWQVLPWWIYCLLISYQLLCYGCTFKRCSFQPVCFFLFFQPAHDLNKVAGKNQVGRPSL